MHLGGLPALLLPPSLRASLGHIHQHLENEVVQTTWNTPPNTIIGSTVHRLTG